MTTKTTCWFNTKTKPTSPKAPSQYALTATRSINPDCSLPIGLVEAVVDVLELPDGQTSLQLYMHVNPDALEEIIEASETKESSVEVRFMIHDYLIAVRSNHTVLIYEPLGAQREGNRNLVLN